MKKLNKTTHTHTLTHSLTHSHTSKKTSHLFLVHDAQQLRGNLVVFNDQVEERATKRHIHSTRDLLVACDQLQDGAVHALHGIFLEDPVDGLQALALRLVQRHQVAL